MSAAARGAAGWRYINRKRRTPILVKPIPGEVERLAQQLQRRFNLTAERANELALEQAGKTFNRAQGGARR